MKEFESSFVKNVETFNTTQKEKFDQMKVKQDEMIKTTEIRLERMRETVDEKLHKTLEERLGKSFEMVTKQLLVVQKGLGEMQNIASGVGDLKKVLSNVKTRGVLGEIQLGNILEEIMTPDQYDKNVKTKKGLISRLNMQLNYLAETKLKSQSIYLLTPSFHRKTI